MRILVLGAGRMGFGAVYDLARQRDVDAVTIADVSDQRTRKVAAGAGNGKAAPIVIDVTDAAPWVAFAHSMRRSDDRPKAAAQTEKARQAGLSLCFRRRWDAGRALS